MLSALRAWRHRDSHGCMWRAGGVPGVRRATRVQARLIIKGIQKPRPEFETVGACLIMLHDISDAGANFECWYVEFLEFDYKVHEALIRKGTHKQFMSNLRSSWVRMVLSLPIDSGGWGSPQITCSETLLSTWSQRAG